MQASALTLSCTLLMMASPIASAYYDDTAGDKQVAYQYLDQVEKDVGFETFAATSDAYSRRLLD